MVQPKFFAIIISVALLTATGMSALVADRMRVVTVCKDVRIGMDGGIGATLEFGGLSPHFLVNLFTQHYKGHDKLKTLGVYPDPAARHSEMYVAKDFKLVVSKAKNLKSDRYPASLETYLDGKKVTVSLACTK